MSVSRKTPILLLLLAVVILALNGVVLAQEATSTPSVPVKIAVMAPITGSVAALGTEQLDWAKLAVEDFNKATGWNVQVVEGDTQLNPAIAVTVAAQLISDNDIYGVVGPAGSQEVEATEKAFQDARLVEISGSATRPSLTQGGFDTFFRVVPTDDVQGPSDASFIYDQLGVTSLFVIDDQTSYSTGLADAASNAFTAAGGTIAGRESVTQQDQDFSSLVTKIGASGAGAIFFPGQVASQGAVLAKQLQEQGLSIIIVGADGFQSPDFITGAAGASEGDYASSFAPDIHTLASSADIAARYTAEYGDYTAFGPPCYAAAMAILDAMQRANDAGNLTRAGVRDEVAKTDVAVSVLGTPLAFDQNGDVLNASFYMFQISGNGFVYVPSTSVSTATPEATPSS